MTETFQCGLRRRTAAAVAGPRGRPAVERLEERCLPDCSGTALVERTFDGTCNNLTHPEWGSTNVALLRKVPVAYADGISAPVVGSPPRPSPRVISNAVSAQADKVFDDRFMAAMVYAFGQFIDHDLDLTTPAASPPEPFDIPVPKCDVFFDPDCTGTQVINFNRSNAVPGTGTGLDNPREQPNQITAFIDGSMIYGSDPQTADMLRAHKGGKLTMSSGNLLPFNNSDFFPGCPPDTPCLPMANDAHIVPDTQLFAAGDVRANENVELLGLQTLFVREHNFWARQIFQENPTFTDEQVYQLARHIVGAELEVIAYKEWIPTVFGPDALPAYAGYDATVNPGVATEFSTAAFRVGHSMLGNDVQFLGNDGQPVADSIPLSEAFFNPPVVSQVGIGPILKYLASDPSEKVDTMLVDAVRNFLFGPPGSGGFDLASLNIQRGRDHGLADYNSVRAAYGLAPVTSFAEITSGGQLQKRLQTLYGNVDNIDAWVGGLAEDHVPGTSTGELLRRVILEQFERARDGDRFWYQNFFTGDLLNELEGTTLRTVIARNTEINNLQDDVFTFKLIIHGTVFNDQNHNGVWDPGEPGIPGRNVRLIDAVIGEQIARTRTDPNGNYHYTNLQDGLHFGTFQVRVVVPSGWVQTTPDPPDIVLTEGADVVANFGLAEATTGPGAPAAGAPPFADAGTADGAAPGLQPPALSADGTAKVPAPAEATEERATPPADPAALSERPPGDLSRRRFALPPPPDARFDRPMGLLDADLFAPVPAIIDRTIWC
jgi:hypothetical protein